jgi:hypothetical protein
MHRSTRFILAVLPLCVPAATPAAPPKAAEPAVAATVETTLGTAWGQVRQFAFDGDAKTYFASAHNAGRADHFTVVFDKPVGVKSIAVSTGRPSGDDRLDAGTLEVSEDGKKFDALTPFAEGEARANPGGRQLRAVRLRPTADLKHPLAVREVAVESDPPVATFKYPVEFIVDVAEAPEMKGWAEKAARVCERHYAMICEELKSDGFRPRQVITLTLKKDYDGVAATSGGDITGSAKHFKEHPDDVGAMVHETVHCVQQYRNGPDPGWLVEGIADYLRFYKYEPVKPRPPSPDRARYNGSYRVTAAFLAFVTEKYDQDIVRKLNQALREGEYKEEVWKQWTGKTVQELGEEWRASLDR